MEEMKNQTVNAPEVNQDVVNDMNENAQGEQAVKSRKRVLTGKVVSNKCDKTISVSVERSIAHPLYKKYYKRSKNFMAHDVDNTCNIGDTVKIKECRPLSAKKRWELVEILERAK